MCIYEAYITTLPDDVQEYVRQRLHALPEHVQGCVRQVLQERFHGWLEVREMLRLRNGADACADMQGAGLHASLRPLDALQYAPGITTFTGDADMQGDPAM